MSLITFYVNVTVTKEGTLVRATPLGIPMFLTTHTVTANRADVYADLDEMETDGWTSTDEGYKWATDLLAQDLTPDQFVIGRIDGGDANITASINAVQAENDDWYFVNIESRADADITDIAAWTEAETKIFIAQTSDSDVPTATTPNILSTLQALSYLRTAVDYHALDAEYCDGAWTSRCGGADLDAEGGVLTWANKTLRSVTVNDLPSAQAQNIRDGAGNVYHKVTSVNNVTTPGQIIAGTEFIDTITTLDWTFFRVTEAVFAALIAPSTKVPFTQSGIDRFINAVKGVLDSGVNIGHFSGDPGSQPVVTGPKIGEVSAADKQARILRDIQGTAVLAGAVHQVIVNVSVSA
jgi:hypothetical protein